MVRDGTQWLTYERAEKQVRQRTYNEILKHVRVTIVSVEKQ
jgi:hypothetical protein